MRFVHSIQSDMQHRLYVQQSRRLSFADVRLVVHYSLPKTLEGFYQESGRAGRDGKPARSVVFYGLSDRDRMDWILAKQKKSKGKKRKAGMFIVGCLVHALYANCNCGSCCLLLSFCNVNVPCLYCYVAVRLLSLLINAVLCCSKTSTVLSCGKLP